MLTRIVDQSESEQRLHRALYILKYLRAYLLNFILSFLAVVLFLVGNIEGIYPSADNFIRGIKAQIVLMPEQHEVVWQILIFVPLIIIPGVLWVYQSIVCVWRWSLKLEAVLLICGILVSLWLVIGNELRFAIDHLAPIFVGLLGLYYVFGVVLVLDMAVALWGVSRSPDTSSFRATLDPRLTSGLWSYLNKLLDLPRTPLRSVYSITAYALAVLGAALLIACIDYIMSVGHVDNKFAQLKLACGEKNFIQCAVQSATWANDMVMWLIMSLIGLKIAALMQSAAKMIGGIAVSDAIKHAGGRYVLYLRPFYADAVILPKPRLPIFSQLVTLRPFSIRIEQELFDVADGYLPLVAVGAPGDRNRTSGDRAYREYLVDSMWQSFVAEKLCHADSIVVVISNTEGVRWELSRVFEGGHATKTLFLFDPSAKDAAVWDCLSALLVPAMKAAQLVFPDFRFQGRPLGFYFHGSEIVEIQNSNWSATSYRSSFSHFLSERVMQSRKL